MNERIKQNLIDAGCDSDFISRFDGCICDPKACERLLAEHRRELLAMNHYDMEEHSRPERLTEFKVAYGASLDAVRVCLDKFFPHIDRERFIYVFFPFLFGVYPYAVASDKQLSAMNEANCKFELHSIYDMVFLCVKQLLARCDIK